MSNIHSLYGSMFGIRNSNGVPYFKDVATGAIVASDVIGASNIETFTSTGETINKYGINILAPTSAGDFVMPAPTGSGRLVRVISNSASTDSVLSISSGSGSFQSSAGSSMFNILFTAAGAGVDLLDISTVWRVVNHHGSSAAVISS